MTLGFDMVDDGEGDLLLEKLRCCVIDGVGRDDETDFDTLGVTVITVGVT